MPLRLPTESRAEVVERVRVLLNRIFEGAAEVTETSRHVADLAIEVYQARDRLSAALDVVHGPRAPERIALVWKEATLASLRRPELLQGAEHRTDLLRVWWQLLLDATEKVERDRRDAELYAAAAEHRDDDDREWSDAAARHAGERWTD